MQKQWSFQDVTGHHYYIGLYHGQESGHFLLYINDQVSIIDFDILDDKSYSLYIGNELFRLKIEKTAIDNFSYNLDPVSPRLIQKPWEQWRDRIIMGVMVLLVIAALVLLAYIAFFNHVTPQKLR